jgi:hypothetical protein
MTAQYFSKTQEQIQKTTPDGGYSEWKIQADQVASQVGKTMAAYHPITLKEMDAVSLMNRTDTKYVLHVDQLAQALTELSDRYRVLEISRRRIHAYQNLYFDTTNFELFIQHHRGMRDRYKVRCREYADSGLTYLEIKRKNNRNRTIKSRLRTSEFIEDARNHPGDFLPENYPYSQQDLNPVLWNQFHRITLVSTHTIERLTLDINLGFSDGWNQFGLPGIAVAEIKQDGFSIHSDFLRQMRAFGIQMQRFSKYCMGITMFYPSLKANNFKPRTLLVNRIMRKHNPTKQGA